MVDQLRIRNLTFYARHGLLPEEARLGQRFEVDVELRVDLAPAGAADDPSRTIDYAALCKVVEETVTGQRRFQLVEGLAEAVAAAVGVRAAAVFGAAAVVVRVRKPNPPVDAVFDGLEVEIERSFGG